MQVLCAICSKDKDHAAGLLPAAKRYTSERIKNAVSESQSRGLPLFFLSGEFGLIFQDELIPDYNHKLSETEVEGLVQKVANQIEKHEISELVFLAKKRTIPGWAPYYRLIELACRQAGAGLLVEKV